MASGPRIYRVEPSPPGSGLVVVLGPADALRAAFGGAYKLDGGLGIEAPWVVTEPDGWLVRPSTLAARWQAIVKVADVTPITLHGARHSYAELALGAGVRLDVVSRQLGHASISTTGNVYLNDSDEAATDAAAKVGAILEGRR